MSDEEVIVGGQLPPANAVGAIIISQVSNAKWTKDGQSVYCDLTDQHGTTRTFAWPIEIANHLIAALSTGIAGCHRIARGG
jgi:hypothetical protein